MSETCAAGLPADSAGTPWAGRRFEANRFAADDGTAPAAWLAAVRRFRLGEIRISDVIAELHRTRLLIPLVAHLEQGEITSGGLTADKAAELATVTVATPDGQRALPVFSSVQAMQAWNPDARPVPAEAPRVALAAAGEHTPRVVVDPGTESEFVVRWPALEALATGETWRPAIEDPRVLDAFLRPAAELPSIKSLVLVPGDPHSRLAGPEILVQLEVIDGLEAADLQEMADWLGEQWRADETIMAEVDSIGVRFVRSPR